jgi:phage shock protein PspC (stress-responsive transcriptional regulator)
MKKIININLSGRVIPIEDSAYESLQRYIESLRRYFANEEGRDEIINDIESRIAELMNDQIRKGATAITDEDVNEIIGSMGRVEDFAEVDSDTSASSAQDTGAGAGAGTAGGQQYYSEPKQPKGRLYRNNTDKFLGGVCSGIANYLNFDPAVVRLLFAIITFGGFGLGFLIYILLWIILPARDFDGYTGKRIFRNPDDRIIGGVAGGLAAYFNKSVKVIRLIFAAPLILNIFFNLLNGLISVWRFDYSPLDIAFGSITSTFILIYIILWIVLPEAKTPYDKMEMRGETVDVNRIRQNVQEGMGDFSKRAQAWGEEVKDSARQFGERARNFANTRGKTFASEASAAARPAASGIGHVIGVLFKAFFLFVAGSIAFALFVGLMILIFGGGTVLWPLKQALLEFVLDGFWQNAFFWGTVLFFFAVPLIAFMTWLIRRIMKVKSSSRNYLGWTFGGLWVIGWISLFGLATTLARDFSQYEEVRQPLTVSQPTTGRMQVIMSEPEVRYRGDLFFVEADNNGWNFTDDSLQLGNVQVNVMRSEDSNYHVNVIRYSRGRSSYQAEALAQKIRYNVTSRDSILDLGSGYAIARRDKFRGQEVEVQIMVPVGKRLRFDASVANKLSPFRVRFEGHRRGFEAHVDNGYVFGYRTGIDYIMNANGRLLSADGSEERSDARNEEESRDTSIDGYRYDRDTTNAEQRRLEIEAEKKRIRDEAEKRIRQLEESQRRTSALPAKNQGTAFRSNLSYFSVLI